MRGIPDDDMTAQIIIGDCIEVLRTLPEESIHCCVTSPPYWGLRDYGVGGQIGQEPTPEEFTAKLVEVFREVRRVLRAGGTLWVNLGDSYAANRSYQVTDNKHIDVGNNGSSRVPCGLKPKDLIGIPWRVAFALQADGWFLRKDIIWAKPNGMPESVRDRPTSSHEYVFLLSKSETYIYNYEAVRLPALPSSVSRLEQHVEAQLGSIRANGLGNTNGAMKAVGRKSDKQRGHSRRHDGFNDRWDAMEKEKQQENGSALRSVWWISPAQTNDAHFAVMPSNLAATCILAGSRPGDTILDPFGGSGTTGMVATELGRSSILIELNPKYAELCRKRGNVTPGLAL
jgi:DNA modification methylase